MPEPFGILYKGGPQLRITVATNTPERNYAMTMSAAGFSAIFAGGALAGAVATYFLNHRTYVAKLFDRLYELDKLILGHPGAFLRFAQESTRPTDDYFQATEPSEEYYKLKAFAYFYLNLFDEIYGAYGFWHAQTNEAWMAWQNYMFERLRHPLIRELLMQECSLRIEGGRVCRDGPAAFTDGFASFLCDQHEKWRGPCGPRHF